MSRTIPPKPLKTRLDGWTPERQLRFLQVLGSTRSVTKAAASVRMSREGAYRLRKRSEGSLFALLWDRALGPEPLPPEVHNQSLTDGRVMRLLGNKYRRERGDFLNIGTRWPAGPAPDRTRTW